MTPVVDIASHMSAAAVLLFFAWFFMKMGNRASEQIERLKLGFEGIVLVGASMVILYTTSVVFVFTTVLLLVTWALGYKL